jgi:hypothetical protein
MSQGSHVAIVVAAIAVFSSISWRHTHAAAPSDAERRIEQALAEQLRSPLDFVETPLSTVLTMIAEEFDIPIQFDEKALESVAQSPETEVSITISNVSLRSALEILLKGQENITYVIENEVLLITSEDEANTRLEVRVYRVDDLVRFDRGESQGQVDPDRVQALRRIIVTNVEKDSWADSEHGEGEICVYTSDLFVVTQTRRVHEQIDDVLAKLRDAAGRLSENPATVSIERPALDEHEQAEDDEG